MHIIYNDENDRLTPEIWKLMEQAFERAMENEFGEELASEGVSLPDIDAELGVSVVDRDEILELNREYRQRDRVTDVLSFPQFGGHDELLEDLLDDRVVHTVLMRSCRTHPLDAGNSLIFSGHYALSQFKHQGKIIVIHIVQITDQIFAVIAAAAVFICFEDWLFGR